MNIQHPLRAAVEAAAAEYEAATEAREALDDDDSMSGDDPRYDAALEREDAAEAALDAAREAMAGSDCPRWWAVYDDGCAFWSGLARSGREAIDLADPTTDPADFHEVESTLWYDVHARCDETGEQEERTIAVEPLEPECVDDGDHDWQSPVELVGGIKENPGVWGHGGGVVVHEACIRCGCRKTTDTWAQRRDTGEQGLTSVEYEPDCYDVSAYAARSLVPEVTSAGCAEAQEAAAWVLRGLRAIRDGDPYEGTPPGTPHEHRIDAVLAYLDRVYRAVRAADEDRALRLAVRLAADNEREQRIAHAIIAAQWPEPVRSAA